MTGVEPSTPLIAPSTPIVTTTPEFLNLMPDPGEGQRVREKSSTLRAPLCPGRRAGREAPNATRLAGA